MQKRRDNQKKKVLSEITYLLKMDKEIIKDKNLNNYFSEDDFQCRKYLGNLFNIDNFNYNCNFNIGKEKMAVSILEFIRAYSILKLLTKEFINSKQKIKSNKVDEVCVFISK